MSHNPSANPSKKRTYDDFRGSGGRQGDPDEDQDILFGANMNQEDVEHGFPLAKGSGHFAGDDEASEDNEQVYHGDEEQKSPSDELDGEDLEDNMENDYQKIAALDRYDSADIDDQMHEEVSAQGRQQVDRELKQQEVQTRRHGRQAGAFYNMEEEDNSENEMMRQMRRREMIGGNEEFAEFDRENGEENDHQFTNDYSEAQGPISAWINRPEVRQFIRRKFSRFLRNFTDDQERHVYEDRIHEMCQHNRQSIEINFTHLSNKQPTIAIWLAEEPAIMLPVLSEVASETALEVYPSYNEIHKDIFVRVRDLPVEDKLRDLRQVHLNALIKFRGVVTKRTGVFPQFKEMYFRCVCGDLKGPTFHNSQQDARQFLGVCISCQRPGPYTLDQQATLYRNYQKLTVQETPGTVPPGRVPRQKEVYVINDLVDTARPGDEVEITGIYVNRFDYFANVRHGFPVFQTYVEANNLKRFGDEDIIECTEEDKTLIRELSKRQTIADDIINSIAPSIYGYEFIKRALALAMFGGQPKDVNGKHRIRGDINVLLLGDPGTAKSQFLKYTEQLYHRVVYTTGKGASAVGLTAGVHKDPITGEWTLEGGALVLADKGICLIDEFDKMNEQDRTSIHEAMEQQTISISKAGIVTQLQARCSVIAAANPIGGIYRVDRNFNDNVELTDPILSRFDILTVIKDEAKMEEDDMLATFVINSHMKNHPSLRCSDPAVKAERDARLQETLLDESHIKKTDKSRLLDQELLKKYIIYAKKYVHPRLSEIDKEKVTSFYAKIRHESSAVGGIPIAVRHIESVLRMSEAYARIHLRDYVHGADIDFAINMLLESFLQTQKASVARALSKKFESFKKKPADVNSLLYHILNKIVKERAVFIKYTRGIEQTDRVTVELPIDYFKRETSEFGPQKMVEFFMSPLFNKEFKVEGKNIKTVLEI